MKIEKRIFSTVNVRLHLIALILLLLGTLISGYYYYKGEPGNKTTALFGSFLTGLILVIVQFLFDYAEYTAMSRIQRLGVKNILIHREDKEFYRNLIAKAEKRIDVMGVTASRFMEDFADSDSGRQDTTALLEAMSRGALVRILVPELSFLEENDQRKGNAASKYFKRIGERFQHKFQQRYFEHQPMHSIVVIDDECLLGPVLPDVASRHTPAIYIETNSPYARRYLEYFEKEWDKAIPSPPK